MASKHDPAPPGKQWIYPSTIRHYKTGKLIRASDHGLRCFRILVSIERKHDRDEPDG